MGLLASASNALSLKRREKGFSYRVAVADAAQAHRSLRRTCPSAPTSKGPIWAADVIEARKFRDGRPSRIDWRGIYPALSSFLGSSTNALTGERACRLRPTTDRLEVGCKRTVFFRSTEARSCRSAMNGVQRAEFRCLAGRKRLIHRSLLDGCRGKTARVSKSEYPFDRLATAVAPRRASGRGGLP